MSKSVRPIASSGTRAQRAGYISLAVAGTLSLTAPGARANTPTQPHGGGPMPILHINQPGGHNNGWYSPTGQTFNNVHFPTSTSISNGSGAPPGHVNSMHVHKSSIVLQGVTSTVASPGGDLNLASSSQSFDGGSLANFKSLTIQVGSDKEVVSLGTKLTAAEVVAAEQVLTSGRQTIKLDASGAASGGTVTLNNKLLTAIDSSLGGSLGGMTVSQGVKVIDLVSHLNVDGNLTNYGTILTAATHPGATNTITADAILNAAGGTIASYSGGGGLYGTSTVLNAAGGLTNNGSISSSGSLSINAPVINNIAATGGGAPTISAQHNVNLVTQQVNNEGTIAALTGNINIASQNANLSLNGGNYLSQQLNLESGTGNMLVNVDEVSGVFNASGNCLHMIANTPDLKIGAVNATADPLMAVSGDITIIGTGFGPTNGAALTLIASGNILGGKGAKGLDTSSKTGDGGALTLVAGANFVDSAGVTTVTGNSGTGGIIDLTGKGLSTGAVATIKTGGATGKTGGAVTLIAFNGGVSGSGSINVSKTAIDTTVKSGTNGDVTMIAGETAPSTLGISTGTIKAGNITLANATPSSSPVQFDDTTGAQTSGAFTVGSLTTTNFTAGAITASGNVAINGGSNVSLSTISGGAGSTISVASLLAQTLTITKAITGGTIQLSNNSGLGGFLDVTIQGAVGNTTTNQVTISGANLRSAGSGVVTAKNVTLNSTSDIGPTTFVPPSKFINAPFVTKANNLTVNSTGDVNIKQTGDVTLGTSSFLNNFNLTGSGNITLGAVSATGSFCNLNLTTSKNVTLDGVIDPNIFVSFTTKGTFTVTSNGSYAGSLLSPITCGNFVNHGTIGDPSGNTGIEIIATGSGKSIDNFGTIVAGSTILTTTNTSASIVNEDNTCMINASTINLNSNNVVNNGTVKAGIGTNPGELSVFGLGNMVISGTGTLTNTPFSSFQFGGPQSETIGPKNITIGSGPAGLGNDQLRSISQLSEFSVNTLKGSVTTSLNAITLFTNPSGKGGNFQIIAFGYSFNGGSPAGPFAVTFDTSNTPAGTDTHQAITFLIGGTKGQPITIGTNTGDFQFLANGTPNSNTNVAIFSSGHFQIDDPSKFQFNGANSANSFGVQIQSAQGIAINGDISTMNGDGKYSNLTLITGVKSPFVIGAASQVSNGQYGLSAGQGLAGGVVTLTNGGGIEVAPGMVLQGTNGVSTSAPSLQVDSGATMKTPSVAFTSGASVNTLTNNGTINTPSGDFLVQVAKGNLTVASASGAAYNVAGALTFNVALGSINITSVPTAGLSAHDLTLDALKGGITIGGSTSTSLTAAPDGSFNGGTISIAAATLTPGTGGLALSATASGAGNGGTVAIELTGTKTVTVGTGGLSIDVTDSGANNGANVSITNGGLVSVTDASQLNLTNSNGLQHASLTLGGKGVFVNDESILTAYGLHNVTITSTATTSFLLGGAKTGTNGFGATGKQLAADAITLQNIGAIDTTNGSLSASTETLAATKGSLIFAPNATYSVNPDGAGNGGSLTLTGTALTGATNVTFSALGPVGNGGTIELTITGTKALAVGPSGVSFDVRGNNGQGGSLTVYNGGNLSVDASATGGLKLGASFLVGKGANLSLASNALLFVSGTDNISNIGLHNVSFTSNSKTTFVLSGATSKGNGLSYTGVGNTFNADKVTVTNNGGSIDYTSGVIIANTIGLAAPKGALLLGSNPTVQPTRDAAGDGGILNLAAQTLTYTGALTLDVSGSGTGNGGAATLAMNAKTFAFGGLNSTVSVNIANGDNTGNAGSFTVSNSGNLSVDLSSGILYGLSTSGKGASLSIASNGLLNVTQVNFAEGHDLHNLAFSSASKTPILLGGATSKTNGIVDVGLDIVADNVSVTSTGGAINAGSVHSLSGTSSVTLSALTDVGQIGIGIPIASTPALSINTGAKGNAFIATSGATTISQTNIAGSLQITSSGGSLVLGTSAKGNVVTAGSINLTYTDAVDDNLDVVTLNQITATTGNITVTSNAQELLIGTNALLSTLNGNIDLQNTGTTTSNAPLIQFNSGSILHASSISQSDQSRGDIQIVVGPIPPNIFSGTPPANATLLGSTGLMAFGATTITATDKTDILNSIGRYMQFTTPSATGINLATNVQIIADPPPPPAAPFQAPAFYVAAKAPIVSAPMFNQEIRATAITPVQALASGDNTSTMLSGVSSSVVSSTTSSGLANSSVGSMDNKTLYGGVESSVVQSMARSVAEGSRTPGRSLKGTVLNLKHQALTNGALLLAPDETTVVDTPYGTVTISKSTVALLMSSDKGLTVYNLHDKHKGAVTIDTDGSRTTLSPGLSAILTRDQGKTFEELNPAPFVAYRGVTSRSLGHGLTMHHSEYQIISLLRGLPQLRTMLASDSPKKRKAMADTLKTAAILMTVSSGAEQFSYRVGPQATAWSQLQH